MSLYVVLYYSIATVTNGSLRQSPKLRRDAPLVAPHGRACFCVEIVRWPFLGVRRCLQQNNCLRRKCQFLCGLVTPNGRDCLHQHFQTCRCRAFKDVYGKTTVYAIMFNFYVDLSLRMVGPVCVDISKLPLLGAQRCLISNFYVDLSFQIYKLSLRLAKHPLAKGKRPVVMRWIRKLRIRKRRLADSSSPQTSAILVGHAAVKNGGLRESPRLRREM